MRDGRYEVGPTGISMPYAYAGVLERKDMTGGSMRTARTNESEARSRSTHHNVEHCVKEDILIDRLLCEDH